MSRFLTKLGVMLVGSASVFTVTAQEVDYVKYPDYVSPDKLPVPTETTVTNKQTRGVRSVRPDHVDNSKTPYFPAVFNQHGGSCGSASRIGYMFTHEINSYRRADASLPENVYPTHFTWLLTGQNSGKEQMARDNGVPNSVVYGGKLYSDIFGGQVCENNNYGWMQGYDKWYHAMFNRIETNEGHPSLGTEEGREFLKNWLWNHCGDEDFGSGGIAGIGVASACTQAAIPATQTNNSIGVTGLKYVSKWGKTVDHALTIVGYDDRIEFDLDGDGKYGEVDEDEVGAWIIVNSWGQWANKGFIYCPYKHARINTSAEGVFGSWMTSEVYKVRKNYRPLRTIKLRMDYTHRSEIKLSVGVASDANATEPEKTIAMHHFIYAGAGNGNKEDPEVPMLGRWKDGIHHEPMEFGYDMTDLSSGFNLRDDLKYFFIVETKKTGVGSGHVYECSVLDYEFDEEGNLYTADLPAGGAEIKSAGNKLVIPIRVLGEKLNAPFNAMVKDGKLSWSAPMPGAHKVKAYKVFDGDELFATVPASTLACAVSGKGSYTVLAVYDLYGNDAESARSNAAAMQEEVLAEANQYLNMNNNTVTVSNLVNRHLDEFTVEFAYKPMTGAKTVMLGDGKFGITLSSGGQLVAGWGTGDQVASTGTPLSGTQWKHVAVTVKQNVVTLYVNGLQSGQYTSSKSSGIDASEQFILGMQGGLFNAAIDELRFWSKACTLDEVKLLGSGQMAQPALYSGLLAYYRMDQNPADKTVLLDCVGKTTAKIEKNGAMDAYWSGRSLFDKEVVKADFELPAAPYRTGMDIRLKNISSPSSTSFIWDAPEAGIDNLFTLEPVLVYNTPGEYTVTLTVVDKKGVTHNVEKTVTVVKAEIPEVDFEISETSVACGDQVLLVNKTEARDGFTYEWTIAGAEVPTVKTYNARATYVSAGHKEVKLTVRCGSEEASCVKYVDVEEKAPVAGMTVTPTILMKGEKTNLLDASKYDPMSWIWTVENGNRYYVVDGQSSTLTIDKPGKYNVSLKVTNALGTDELVRKNEITVCNADSKNGLNFDGADDEVVVENLFTGQPLTAFTIDWWMRASEFGGNRCLMGDKNGAFTMTTAKNGQMTVKVNNISAKSSTGYVEDEEWHHYAVAYNAGKVTFYRDGLPVGSSTALPESCPAWTGGFHMGGTTGPLNATVDELRIWKAALTDEQVLAYCNAPLENVSELQTNPETALELYFTFDQNGGDVTDATSNAYVGKRLNFGPDGDAWGLTTGNTFWLDVENEKTDVTSMYLKNYRAPFLYDADSYVNGTERFRTLSQETEESPWKIENSAYNESTNVRTEFYVDANKDNCLALINTDGFATSIKNLKLWQTVTLPAGAYEFGITPHAENEFFTTGSYIAAEKGEGLPDTENIATAFASAEARLRTVTFVLTEETTLSLGLVMNMSGLRRTFTVNDFTLVRRPFELLEADGAVEIDGVVADNKAACRAEGGEGTLTLSTSVPTQVTVVTTDAKTVYSGVVDGKKTIKLPAGLYIANNQKVVVR